jgi:hypothetical protein
MVSAAWVVATTVSARKLFAALIIIFFFTNSDTFEKNIG